MRPRAVIFDLWDTLVMWPVDEGVAHRNALRERLGVTEEEFERRWTGTYRERQTGTLADAYAALGVTDGDIATYVDERTEVTRRVLRPREGALDTLDELGRRGVPRGLISMCSEDVPVVWPDTEFAERFEVATFSATCGLVKPEPEIYLHTAAELGVDPTECYFVGDGANDELRGAQDVGMTPVLVRHAGREPYWPEVRDWNGLGITELPEVLDLL
jgi:putative hydrolase of the HAD superfamily